MQSCFFAFHPFVFTLWFYAKHFILEFYKKFEFVRKTRLENTSNICMFYFLSCTFIFYCLLYICFVSLHYSTFFLHFNCIFILSSMTTTKLLNVALPTCLRVSSFMLLLLNAFFLILIEMIRKSFVVQYTFFGWIHLHICFNEL